MLVIPAWGEETIYSSGFLISAATSFTTMRMGCTSPLFSSILHSDIVRENL